MTGKGFPKSAWMLAAGVLCVALAAAYVVLVVVGLNRTATRLVGTFHPRF